MALREHINGSSVLSRSELLAPEPGRILFRWLLNKSIPQSFNDAICIFARLCTQHLVQQAAEKLYAATQFFVALNILRDIGIIHIAVPGGLDARPTG